jgi:transcriptional regulator with XRE-family HTH domain
MPGKKRRHDPEFRAEVARRIRAKVRELRKAGVSEAAAARQIEVSPQGFNRYVRGLATPKPEILARICAEWGLKFSYRSKEFGSEAFSAPEAPRDERKSEQLSLFDEPQELHNRNLKLKVQAGKATTLNVSLEIRFAS